jgi:hypothetical protein
MESSSSPLPVSGAKHKRIDTSTSVKGLKVPFKKDVVGLTQNVLKALLNTFPASLSPSDLEDNRVRGFFLKLFSQEFTNLNTKFLNDFNRLSQFGRVKEVKLEDVCVLFSIQPNARTAFFFKKDNAVNEYEFADMVTPTGFVSQAQVLYLRNQICSKTRYKDYEPGENVLWKTWFEANGFTYSWNQIFVELKAGIYTRPWDYLTAILPTLPEKAEPKPESDGVGNKKKGGVIEQADVLKYANLCGGLGGLRGDDNPGDNNNSSVLFDDGVLTQPFFDDPVVAGLQ